MGITLLKKGALVANDGLDTTQAKLDKLVPLDHVMDWIRARLGSVGLANRVLVLKSDTGSGKSTAFPPTIFKNFFKKDGAIAVTQPRVLTAVSIVKDQIVPSGFYPWMKLGETIGYQTGPLRKVPDLGVIYMTMGVLLMQLRSMSDQQILDKYRFIVVDEVHEASIDQALTLYMLKNLYTRNAENPKLPFLILTSATLDTEKFLKYFNVYNAPAQPNLIQVRGFTYPLVERWERETGVFDYLKAAAETVKKIHTENYHDDPKDADILVFLPGGKEIMDVRKDLEKVNANLLKAGDPVFMILTIDSDAVIEGTPDYTHMTTVHDKLIVKIGEVEKKPLRRVILSTSVAETGLTIDTLRYVVDCGYSRGPEYNPQYDAKGILTKPAPKSRIRQRMGRANRKSEGVFYPLYPKYVYDKLPDLQLADIETSAEVSQYILQILVEQLKMKQIMKQPSEIDLRDIDLLDPIPRETLTTLFEKLYVMGFVSPISTLEYTLPTEDYNLDLIETLIGKYDITGKPAGNIAAPRYSMTRLGVLAAGLSRLSLEQTRMVLAAFAWKCSPLDLANIVAYLQIPMNEFAEGRDPIEWIRIYELGLPKHMRSNKGLYPVVQTFYRAKLLFGDNFMDGIMLFNSCRTVISGSRDQSYLNSLKGWCKLHKVKFETILSFLKIREDVIEQLVSIGLDAFQSKTLYDIGPDEFVNHITRIKHCIFEGYRMNLLTLANDKYYNLAGEVVATPDLFQKNELTLNNELNYGIAFNKPKYLVHNGLSMKLNKTTQLFELKPDRVAMMDGYVKVDDSFLWDSSL